MHVLIIIIIGMEKDRRDQEESKGYHGTTIEKCRNYAIEIRSIEIERGRRVIQISIK
jgi:hypothetical protein